MDDEAAFLAAMRAAPADRLTRYVYADWLEERGDPRHELVRVCEAMRAVPVWSDTYWDLKARRNALWTQFPIEWLEATGYDGSDYDPIFRDGVPDGVRERWRLIREFTERWHGIPVPDVGGQRDVIAREEARLGLTLPESLRECVAFARDVHFEWTGSGRDRSVMSHHIDGVVHFLENEQILLLTCDCAPGIDNHGVELANINHPDPPVSYFTDDDGNGPVRQPGYSAPTVTRWVLGQVVGWLFNNQSMNGQLQEPYAYRSMCGYPHEPRAYIDRLSAGYPIHVDFDGYPFYESNELLAHNLSHSPPDGMRVSSRVSVKSRRQMPSGSLPDFLFEGEPPSGDPLELMNGLSRQHWDEVQRQRALYDWMPQWRSVLRWDEYERVRPTTSC